jgi:hypothetical protein
MEQTWDPDEDVPWVPRRGEYVPPPWFEREVAAAPEGPADAVPTSRFSWLRTIGLLALVLLIVGLPVQFAIEYYSSDDALGRTNMTLGFVWAVVIEAAAVWGLIRMLTRR